MLGVGTRGDYSESIRVVKGILIDHRLGALACSLVSIGHARSPQLPTHANRVGVEVTRGVPPAVWHEDHLPWQQQAVRDTFLLGQLVVNLQSTGIKTRGGICKCSGCGNVAASRQASLLQTIHGFERPHSHPSTVRARAVRRLGLARMSEVPKLRAAYLTSMGWWGRGEKKKQQLQCHKGTRGAM